MKKLFIPKNKIALKHGFPPLGIQISDPQVASSVSRAAMVIVPFIFQLSKRMGMNNIFSMVMALLLINSKLYSNSKSVTTSRQTTVSRLIKSINEIRIIT